MAEEWFAQVGCAAVRSAVRGTVKDALETYIRELAREGRQDTAGNAEDRFELLVWSDPIADIRLESLTLDDMEEWRERIRDGRQNRTVNRHVRSIVAGLNLAKRRGHVGHAEAWAFKSLPDDIEETAETTIFLSLDQRAAIIKAASPACAAFLTAIAHTGGRPGELASSTRQDFEANGQTLILRHRKGRPAKLRPRAVTLLNEAVKFFKTQARGKLPSAPLLLDPNGATWGRHKWADEVQDAIARHNKTAKGADRIPRGVSAYSFRHARISEMLQIGEVDPMTVAQQTGTSTRMIEQYYFRFIAPALRDKLAAIDRAF
jgi:integrase